MRVLAAAGAGFPELPGLWSLTPLGALLGLAAFVTLAIVRGWLIPKSTHELVLAAANKRGDEWKETALKGREQNDVLLGQNGVLIEANRTAAEFMGTINRRAGGGPLVAQQEATDA